MIQVVGAKGKIRDVDGFLQQVTSFAQHHDVVIQAFNADVIYGENHLISAGEHALRAFERKTNTTNSLEMEILLYASGERQLKLAIPKMGVIKGDSCIAFIFVSEKDTIGDQLTHELLKGLSLVKDEKVLEGNLNTLKEFGISEDEIKTVTKAKYGDIILEKVAMVDIIK